MGKFMTTKTEQMARDLVKQSEEIKEELIELERNFNIKKEQFIKIQGALEALQFVQQQETPAEPEESENEAVVTPRIKRHS
jgi:hypothetical protein